MCVCVCSYVCLCLFICVFVFVLCVFPSVCSIQLCVFCILHLACVCFAVSFILKNNREHHVNTPTQHVCVPTRKPPVCLCHPFVCIVADVLQYWSACPTRNNVQLSHSHTHIITTKKKKKMIPYPSRNTITHIHTRQPDYAGFFDHTFVVGTQPLTGA